MLANCECGAWAWAPLQHAPKELDAVLATMPAGLIDRATLRAARFFVCRACGGFGVQWAEQDRR